MSKSSTFTPTHPVVIIAARWRKAYKEWEDGIACSPSAHDLVEYGLAVTDPEDLQRRVDRDALSEQLFERLEDGPTLIGLARWFYGEVHDD